MIERLKNFWTWIRAGRKNTVIAGAALLVLIFAGYRIAVGSKGKTPQYQTANVARGTIVETVSASGKVLTTNTLAINTQASGVVKAVYVKDGDKVYIGQKIAEITLDSDGILATQKAWASLKSAENSYRSSQASLANVYDQIKGNDTTETFAMKETRTRAEVANDNAWVNLQTARLSYRQMSPTITAPFSGIVQSVNLVEGMVLSSSTSTTNINSQRVAVIKGNSLPVVNVSLSEIDVASVKVGQKVTVTFDSIPDKTFTGKVATVDRVGTVSSNVTSYSANIKLDSESEVILPNMAATAGIIIDTVSDVLEIPSSALIVSNGQTMAKTLQNGREVDVPVTVGLSSDTATEIKSGLTEGQVVITGVKSGSSSSSSGTRSVFSGGFGGGTGGGGARVFTSGGGGGGH